MITKEAVSSDANLSNAIEHPMSFYYGLSTAYDWYTTTTLNDNLWGGVPPSSQHITIFDFYKTIFDPCPAGWRVPIFEENKLEFWPPWTPFSTETFPWSNYGCTYEESFYPAAGYRDYSSGEIGIVKNDDFPIREPGSVGTNGYYWSGSVLKGWVYCLNFKNNFVETVNLNYRANGFSVRCVKE